MNPAQQGARPGGAGESRGAPRSAPLVPVRHEDNESVHAILAGRVFLEQFRNLSPDSAGKGNPGLQGRKPREGFGQFGMNLCFRR